jgi:hypothetical protein
MKRSILLAVLVLSVLTVSLPAATLTDNFNSGISSTNWETNQADAADAPWTISATTGALEISKSADNDSSTVCSAGVMSKFCLDGNFSIFTDFNLHVFPLSNNDGYNEILLIAYFTNSNKFFETLKVSRDGQYFEGYSNWNNSAFGVMDNYNTNGKLGITRLGQTVSAWIDGGNGLILLGSLTSPDFLGPIKLQIAASQQVATYRPSTALDVAFDNFTATADSIIIPEPMTVLLFGLGGLLVSRRKK